jgi:hypothetical protein
MPDLQSYTYEFTNIDGEKYEESTLSELPISTEGSVWYCAYDKYIYAKLIPGISNHPYLFDLLDFWHTKYCK